MAFNFEKLNVWHDSIELAGDIYDLTKKFPKTEIYSLTSQINRASDSVSLNIAEGSTGQSKPEFSRFLGYSIRSGIEVVGCLYLAKRKGFIDDKDFKTHYDHTERLVVKVQALRNSLCRP